MAEEQQAEEREVLASIYEGDTNFIQAGNTSFQYKYGEEGDNKAFLLEIAWGSNYPEELPDINLNAFFNRHLLASVKEEIISAVTEEAKQWLGMSMTYTLFEWVKENQEQLLVNQVESAVQEQVVIEETSKLSLNGNTVAPKPKTKKEQLSKAQKRKLFDRTNFRGERPRGWDWVDIVRHLSQTGAKQPSPP